MLDDITDSRVSQELYYNLSGNKISMHRGIKRKRLFLSWFRWGFRSYREMHSNSYPTRLLSQ